MSAIGATSFLLKADADGEIVIMFYAGRRLLETQAAESFDYDYFDDFFSEVKKIVKDSHLHLVKGSKCRH
jgi:polyhydroxyalkanoate synthesis regulator protein